MTGDLKASNQGVFPRFLPYAALFVFSALLYGKTLGFDFIPSWDDYEYVINNTYIRGLTFENLRYIFTRTHIGNYAPLQLLSYSLDYSLWGLDPRGYHLTNVLLHAVNACLVYAVIKKVTDIPRLSFFASLLFAVHTLNVENVAWVSERKTLLTAAFSLAAFLSYIRFREKEEPGYYALTLLLFALALLSKPLTVTFPLVLLAYEWCFKKGGRLLLPLIPFFVLSAAASLIAVYAHLSYSSVEEGSLTFSTLFGAVYPTMLPIYWKYAGLLILPLGLSGYYDTTIYNSFLNPVVAVSLISWTALFIIVLWKGSRQMKFWFLWFWIWFLPVSNIIPIPVYYADRYMYLPAIAFFVLIGALLEGLARRFNMKTAVYALFAAMAIFYSAISFNRMGVWKNELVFWQDTAKKSPGQYKARLNLGYAYEMNGMYDEAEREYRAAIAIYPAQEAISNLEMLKAKKGSSKQ